MNLKEEKRDLFSVSEDYYLAHCIGADFGMGKGIVVEFNKRFNMKHILQRSYPDYLNQWTHTQRIGDCILQGRVFNLITKERYYQKPTYRSLANALIEMRDLCCKYHIDKIAMPKIGCGLDRLKWDQVKGLIDDIFRGCDIEILVCEL
ncbi:macro domain-containing protein [Clostridium sp. HBUAS56010]|uniref:macro domain-containing protein n=1 Tax=Clostridium sp. HBUAS56010 TaxID=2571127 RepID=UPI0011780F29|nr:macro domain-containing protein [Clostridium sp. HBUAS56010]